MKEQDFRGITGHEDIVGYLKKSLASGKTSHAILFSGQKGSGKKTLAGIYAAALECERGGSEPCCACPACRKVFHESHPDVIRLTHEKPATIAVDEIRDQIIASAAVRPFEGRYKIFIIDEADKMTVAAQNALLKTLEEPPEYVIILLLALSAESLLPTIRSRCVTLKVRPLPDEAVRTYLEKELGKTRGEAEIIASFARGSLGKAKAAASDEEFPLMIRRILSLLRSLHDQPIGELVDRLQEITEEKQDLPEYLELMTVWFRDVLCYKATADIDKLIFKNETADLRRQAAMSSYPGLEEILSSIAKAEERLRANVSPTLTVELLLLTIRENIHG